MARPSTASSSCAIRTTTARSRAFRQATSRRWRGCSIWTAHRLELRAQSARPPTACRNGKRRKQHTQMTDEEKALVPIRAYIDALNKGDVDGVRAAFHFPHVSFSRGRVVHSPTAESFTLQDFHNRVGPDGWVRSSID